MILLQSLIGLGFVVFFGLAALGFGGFVLWITLREIDLGVEFRLASESSPVAVKPGSAAKVSGTVRSAGRTVSAPLDGREVVGAVHRVTEREIGPARDGNSVTTEEIAPFYLEGGDRSTVLVDGGVDAYLSDGHSKTTGDVDDLAVDPDSLPGIARSASKTRFTQQTIEEGDEVTVYGTAKDVDEVRYARTDETDDVSTLLTDGGESDHFVVVDDTDALPSIWRTLIGVAFGGVFVLIGLLAIAAVVSALVT